MLGAGEGGIMIALTEKHFTRSEDGQANSPQPQAGARVGVCDRAAICVVLRQHRTELFCN